MVRISINATEPLRHGVNSAIGTQFGLLYVSLLTIRSGCGTKWILLPVRSSVYCTEVGKRCGTVAARSQFGLEKGW